MKRERAKQKDAIQKAREVRDFLTTPPSKQLAAARGILAAGGFPLPQEGL
jgi:hypothetical protein